MFIIVSSHYLCVHFHCEGSWESVLYFACEWLLYFIEYLGQDTPINIRATFHTNASYYLFIYYTHVSTIMCYIIYLLHPCVHNHVLYYLFITLMCPQSCVILFIYYTHVPTIMRYIISLKLIMLCL